jgi:hypothetical protein
MKKHMQQLRERRKRKARASEERGRRKREKKESQCFRIPRRKKDEDILKRWGTKHWHMKACTFFSLQSVCIFNVISSKKMVCTAKEPLHRCASTA